MSKGCFSQFEFAGFDFEKSRMSLMIVNEGIAAVADCSTSRSVSAVNSLSQQPVMAMTPFMGVRISWLILARNSDLARVAAFGGDTGGFEFALAWVNWSCSSLLRSVRATRAREFGDSYGLVTYPRRPLETAQLSAVLFHAVRMITGIVLQVGVFLQLLQHGEPVVLEGQGRAG